MQRATADKMGGFMENALPGESVPKPEPLKGKIIPFERGRVSRSDEKGAAN